MQMKALKGLLKLKILVYLFILTCLFKMNRACKTLTGGENNIFNLSHSFIMNLFSTIYNIIKYTMVIIKYFGHIECFDKCLSIMNQNIMTIDMWKNNN